ncbi:MAG: AAA family ATPase [Polyangiales bacterium]
MAPVLRLAEEPRPPAPLPRPGNSPETGLVGRVAELDLLLALAAAPGAVVSLVGAPGVGKTALARELAARLSHARPVATCELGDVADADGLCATLAGALGLRAVGGDAARAALADALRGPEWRLLVLDGAERLAEAAVAALASLLDRSEPAAVVLTSRRALGLPRERVVPLDALGVSGEAPEGSDAVAMFVQCVRRRREGYRPDAAELAVVAELARQLGGLPRAIELIAAQQRAFDARSLLAQLPERLRGVAERAPALERSLHEALAWSTGALDPEARDLLRACSLFHGPFALDDVRALGPRDDGEAARGVEALLARSLLREAEPARGGAARFAVDESTRAFVREGLRADGGLDPLRRAHARALASVAQPPPAARLYEAGDLGAVLARREDALAAVEALAPLAGEGAALAPLVAALDLLTADARTSVREHDALAAVLARRDVGDPAALTVHAARALVRSLLRRGRAAEADAAWRTAAGAPAVRAAPWLHAALRACEGDVHLMSWRIPEALAALRDAADLARRHGDPLHAARISWLRAMTLESHGRLHEARALLHEAATECGLHGDLPTLARIESTLGSLALEEGRLDAARAHYERTVALARRADVPRLVMTVTGYRGVAELAAGDAGAALRLLDEALGDARGQPRERGAGIFLAASAAAAVRGGAFEDAVRRLGEARAAVGGDPALVAVLGLYAAHVDVSEARRSLALGDRDGALARWRAVLQRVEATRAATLPAPPGAPAPLRLLDASDDARIALRILEAQLAEHGAMFDGAEAAGAPARDARPAPRLAVAHGGGWFSLGGEVVELGARPVLRKLLWALCERSLARPSEAVPAEALVAAAWGDQRLGPKVGASRLYVALGDLRRLGLREVLRSERGGYALDARVEVVFR